MRVGPKVQVAVSSPVREQPPPRAVERREVVAAPAAAEEDLATTIGALALGFWSLICAASLTVTGAIAAVIGTAVVWKIASRDDDRDRKPRHLDDSARDL
jgi:hypothetical protein